MDVRTILRQEVQGLWGDGKGISLAAVAIAWGLLNGARMVYPVIIPYLQTNFGLSLTVAGSLVSVLWFFAAIGQLPGGVLADRYNERSLMIVSTAIVAVALGLVITSSSPIILFAATAIWGLGHSLYPIARITFLSNLYSGRLGSALGVTMATGDIGQTVLPPVATVLAAAIAWQIGLGFIVPALVLAGVAIFATSRTQRSRKRSTSAQSIRDTLDVVTELRNPTMGFMTGILFLYMFIWQSFTTFYPTYLTSIKGVSSSVAGILFGFFFAVGVVVKPVAGAAYDRIGMRQSLIGILTPAVAGFFFLPLIDNIWFLVGVTALISTMLGTGAVTQSFLADAFSDEMQGTGLGVVRTITAALAAAGPVLFGVIADSGYFNEGYVALAVIMAVVVGLTFWMPETEYV
ncbi:MFS transporter [Natrinema soli]|uniref:Nitrate/nitrite transporter n=1 Tax=Natrinema soli TaxID=1930624 RepID=A0ABD5SEF8_9EURY|nr:MFS transporter [Natrinema soli]